MSEGIAIIGLACRYPGANSPRELWENALAGRREFRRIPPERLRLVDYLSREISEEPTGPSERSNPADTIDSTEAAVLSGWQFDRARFRVSGRQFRAADLAHWLALEVAADALVDAGFPEGEGLDRDGIGVLVGNSLTGEFSRANLLRYRWPYVRRTVAALLAAEGWDLERRAAFLSDLEASFKAPFPEPNEETLAGGLANTIAGRIANHFDFHGGGFTVDGACCSSLLAVVQACSALTAGDLSAALVGGVDLSIDPFELIGFARTGALAKGEMRVFDQRSDGFIPGEGCGFVLLVPESEARRRGLAPYAVLRGWGISSDGHGGLSRPEVSGQRLALRRAYARAGFRPDQVGYFEGHGTGTAVGDATELEAVSQEIAQARAESSDLDREAIPIGSIKANIGHTKAAAGLAGLIKATFVVHQRILPPNTGCERPHSKLGADQALTTLDRAVPWTTDSPLRAGVSAMGFGGINAHVVLEAGVEHRVLFEEAWNLAVSAQDAELFLFAAEDAAALSGWVRRIAARAAGLSRSEMLDLAVALSIRAETQEVQRKSARAAIVAATPSELSERLATLLEWLADAAARESTGVRKLDPSRGIFLGFGVRAARVGFLFPGQGSPSPSNGGAFARRFESIVAPSLGDLLATAGGSEAHEVDTAVAQPRILALSLAGATLLDRLGVTSQVAVGHSLGEISALAWAGVLSSEDARALARIRGRAMADCRAGEAGAMLSLGADRFAVAALLAASASGVVIAAENAPRRTVVSGPRSAIERLAEVAAARGIEAQRLRVSHAFHSPAMAAAAGPMGEFLAAIAPLPSPPPHCVGGGGTAPLSSSLPFVGDWGTARRRGESVHSRRVVSTVTGAPLAPSLAPVELASLLTRQLTEPVLFTTALAAASCEPIDLWIEVGPGRALTNLAAESSAAPGIALDAGGASLVGLLSAVGAGFTLGQSIDTTPLTRDRFTRGFDLEPLEDLNREPRFLANPCESAPILDESTVGSNRGAKAPRESRTLEPVIWEAAAPQTPSEPTDAAQVLRTLVAEKTELPLASITSDSRLLADLHLNSITVGQLVASAARRLGVKPPISPLDYAQASLREIADALASQPVLPSDADVPEAIPAGVDSWVRAFVCEWVERPLVAIPTGHLDDIQAAPNAWRLVVPPEHPLAEPLAQSLPTWTGRGVLLCLPLEPSAHDIPYLLAAAQAANPALEDGPFALVVAHRGGAGGFARTLHLERPHVAVRVVDLAFEHPDAHEILEREAISALALGGFAEARYTEDGARGLVRRVPVHRVLRGVAKVSPDLPLRIGDVLVATGGGKGITAECALDLALASGAHLAILGRSKSEGDEADPELVANLARMRSRLGRTPLYLRTDLTDADAVRYALAALREIGPIAGVIHGAGSNRPRRLVDLTEEDFRATLAPKLDGLANVLAAIDPAELRLLSTFGSIIGRMGLAGEADYATANDRLALATERFARQHPHCRTLAFEWSVWSGAGMGERLGTVEALRGQGIHAIPVELGVELHRQLLMAGALGDGARQVSLFVSGRLGDPPTLELARAELPLWRFLETPRAHVPGVELVVDNNISHGTDPHLADHVFRGEPLFAAVLGLEAMSQVAMALLGAETLPHFEDVRLERPIAVSAGETVTVRVAALARTPERVEVVVRCSTSGFVVDHFRATLEFGQEPSSPTLPANKPSGEGEPLLPSRECGRGTPSPRRAWGRVGEGGAPELSTADLYGSILFHRGRFRRLASYRHLAAKECVAELTADSAAWFGSYLPQELRLGDPGARDAAIHGIQACIPHATLLPIAVERIESGHLPLGEPFVLEARERSATADTFVYDLELFDREGRLRERWHGLTLRVVDRSSIPAPWPHALLVPYLERRLGELLPSVSIRVALGMSRASAPVVEQHLAPRGESWRLVHAPDGRPEVEIHGESRAPRISIAHAGDLVFAISSCDTARLGNDLEPVAARSERAWRDLLGPRFALVESIERERREPRDVAATRVWAASESLRKAGVPDDAPLVFDRTSHQEQNDGWLVLRAGASTVATGVAEVRELGACVVFAVAAEPAAVRSPVIDQGNVQELEVVRGDV